MSEIEKAINLLKRMYDVATTLPCIQNPVAYALYQTWKVYDQKSRRAKECTINSQ